MAHDLLTRPSLYEEDFVAWADQQAALIRAGRWEQLDRENLAEEVESLAGSDRRKSESYTSRIIEHLLKLQFTPSPRDYPHWRGEIFLFRRQLARHVTATIRRELIPQLPELFRDEVESLRRRGLLPDSEAVLQRLGDGYSWAQITDRDFEPEPLPNDAQTPKSSA
jgi:hypothetical protein